MSKIIDLHCDTVLKIMEEPHQNMNSNSFHIDFEKLKKGNSLVQFFALYVDLDEYEDPLQMCYKMLDRFYTEMDNHSDKISMVKNYKDILTNISNKKMSAVLAIEEGGVLRGEICNLRNLYRLGVRLITLTWNYPNEIGFPNSDATFVDKGLTEFGFQVVESMNDLGMIIDTSHLSDKGFYDVAKHSKTPFVASHSNARSITDHRRNLTDDMIKVLANKGGVTGLNFVGPFLDTSYDSKVEYMINHAKHIINVGGIECLAIGSDFDGFDGHSEIRDFSEMHKLESGLKSISLSDDDIDKVLRLNALRVIRDTIK